MPFKNPGVIGLIALSCGGAALLFHIISVGSTGWVVYSGADGGIGLFKVCDGAGTCGDSLRLLGGEQELI